MQHEHWIHENLKQRKAAHQFRHAQCLQEAGAVIDSENGPLVNFCSNDYLNLSRSAAGLEAAIDWGERFGHGATASRLVCGSLPCHQDLESDLAAFKGYPAARLFGSGYLANLGIITALAGKGDAIFVDRLSHASVLDGARLSGARLFRFRHNDAQHLNTMLSDNPSFQKRLVVTEALFSMDGDLAPLPALAEVCNAHQALFMVDEAHSTGVFGAQGRGLVSHYGLQDTVNISMGTLSKALGSYGGFACCSVAMQDYLTNYARPFIYSTALPPTVIGPVHQALRFLQSTPDAGRKLLERSARLRKKLQTHGIDTGNSESPIIPLMVGDEKLAIRISESLREKGILAVAIRPPTVPNGTSRIRLTVTLGHEESLIDQVADQIAETFSAHGALT